MFPLCCSYVCCVPVRFVVAGFGFGFGFGFGYGFVCCSNARKYARQIAYAARLANARAHFAAHSGSRRDQSMAVTQLQHVQRQLRAQQAFAANSAAAAQQQTHVASQAAALAKRHGGGAGLEVPPPPATARGGGGGGGGGGGSEKTTGSGGSNGVVAMSMRARDSPIPHTPTRAGAAVVTPSASEHVPGAVNGGTSTSPLVG